VEVNAKINHFFIESYENIGLIKQLTKQPYFIKQFDNLMNVVRNGILRKMSFFLTLFYSLFIVMVLALPIGFILLGGYFVSQHMLTIGALLVFYPLISFIREPIDQLSQFYSNYKDIKMKVKLLSQALNEDDDDRKDFNKIGFRSLSFDSKKFSFDGSKPSIYKNLTFFIKPNEAVLIKGKSGSGKTTIVNMVMNRLNNHCVSVNNHNYDY
jgi:ABC-type bacteriocin/lantibiotic exporter with double-glycine peptidase domain